MRPPIIVAALIVAALLETHVPPVGAVGPTVQVSDPDAVKPVRTFTPDRGDRHSVESRPLRNVIEELSAERTAYGASLTIRLQQPLVHTPRNRELTNPPRLVFDIPADAGGYGNDAVSLSEGPLRTVAVTRAGEASQVVLTLRRSLSHQIVVDGAAIHIRLAEFASPDGGALGGQVHDTLLVAAQAVSAPLGEPLLLAANALPQGNAAAANTTVRADAPPATRGDRRPTAEPPPGGARGSGVSAVTSAIAQADSNADVAANSRRDRWELRANDVKLSAALERWARDAGWRMTWEAERDFDLVLQASFGGTFEQALNTVLRAYVISDFPLQACLHEDHDGNRAVRIFRFGEHKTCD